MTSPSVAPLLAVLDLEQLDPDHFRSRAVNESDHRMFGGLVVAQALMAAGRTVGPTRRVHSLHANFLHGGDPAVPVVLRVENLRESRAFSTRRTTVIQGGTALCTMTSSFQDQEEGLEHQAPMPIAAPPESLPNWHSRLASRARYGTLAHVEWSALEMRCDDDAVTEENPSLQVWVRAAAQLPDDPLLHAAVLAYVSDLSMLAAVPLPDEDAQPHGFVIATLDHSMWFLHDLRVDDWLLHDQVSPGAAGGRGIAWGRVYRQDGRLVATTAQEGLLRARRPPPPTG
ncbi:acyl-CoA thioesterase [Longivirga aurantiaca]|uniref:Acyl-CoA thioesterase n=1 Tax=Longivirga aurantiaca TaxID=1837743 RepID=A0ABW1T3E5_9ACTN